MGEIRDNRTHLDLLDSIEERRIFKERQRVEAKVQQAYYRRKAETAIVGPLIQAQYDNV